MKKAFALFTLVFALTANAAEPLPLFNALLTVGPEHRFVLVSGVKTSPFLRKGDVFEGYAIGAYDAKEGKLTIERDGKTHILGLVSGSATSGGAQTSTAATVMDAQSLLTAMNFEDMMDKTMVGVRRQQAAAVEQMTQNMAPPGSDPQTRNDIAAFQKKLVEEMMSGITGAAMKDEMAKVYSEVFSKEELQSLGAFYQTPTGKVFTDKQPELSEKMNGVIMTKMMTATPKMQQMVQEFRAEMRAKRAAAQNATAPAPAP